MPRLSKNTSDQNNNEVLTKKDTKNEAVKRVSKEKPKKAAKSSVVEAVKSPEPEAVHMVESEALASVEQEEDVSVEVVSKPAPKKRQTKTKEVVPSVVEEETESETVKTDDEVTSSDGEASAKQMKRVRKNVSTDNICSDLDSYITMIDEEISKLKKSNIGGIKFLKGLNKNLKNFKVGFNRYMKKKPKSTRQVNTNAGFSKPVRVSEQMAAFIGLPSAAELVSRVFVTKFLCQYIKSNDLQNPTDKRQIVADSKLSALLNYHPTSETEPLTYYRMQTYMRPHFL